MLSTSCAEAVSQVLLPYHAAGVAPRAIFQGFRRPQCPQSLVAPSAEYAQRGLDPPTSALCAAQISPARKAGKKSSAKRLPFAAHFPRAFDFRPSRLGVHAEATSHLFFALPHPYFYEYKIISKSVSVSRGT
jgi:hypothetical protein